MTNPKSNQSTTPQLDISTELQNLWLAHMKMLLETGTVTSTDLATLARVLIHGGWTLDPKQIPQNLRDKLTTHLDPKHFEDDDSDVLPFAARG